jgi:plasmid stability protein
VHGVQREAELRAIVRDALVGVEDELELRRVALMARLGLAQAVSC